MHALGIDIVLIDPQFAPKVLAKADAEDMVAVIAAAANRHAVDLFPRFAVMRRWHEAEDIPFAAFLSPDLLHMNDWGSACFAKLLGAAITEAGDATGDRCPQHNVKVTMTLFPRAILGGALSSASCTCRGTTSSCGLSGSARLPVYGNRPTALCSLPIPFWRRQTSSWSIYQPDPPPSTVVRRRTVRPLACFPEQQGFVRERQGFGRSRHARS